MSPKFLNGQLKSREENEEIQPKESNTSATREGFEWWDKFCSIPTYMFIKHEENRCHSVRKVEHVMGIHIEKEEASEIVGSMQEEINSLKAEIQKLKGLVVRTAPKERTMK